MEIVIRKVTQCKNVEIKNDGTTIDLGLHNHQECKELAEVLLSAAIELLNGIKAE